MYCLIYVIAVIDIWPALTCNSSNVASSSPACSVPRCTSYHSRDGGKSGRTYSSSRSFTCGLATVLPINSDLPCAQKTRRSCQHASFTRPTVSTAVDHHTTITTLSWSNISTTTAGGCRLMSSLVPYSTASLTTSSSSHVGLKVSSITWIGAKNRWTIEQRTTRLPAKTGRIVPEGVDSCRPQSVSNTRRVRTSNEIFGCTIRQHGSPVFSTRVCRFSCATGIDNVRNLTLLYDHYECQVKRTGFRRELAFPPFPKEVQTNQ